MRLLDVHNLKLHYFPSEKDRPQYAILSHTWGDGEVTLQALATPGVESMPGYAKIKNCCEEARMFGIDYVWIDTCCIDKTSSAELSEAINSMYKWYQFATICYAYLSDVDATDDLKEIKSQLSKARWFTRGWTLQELLAPKMVVFYNRDWTEIGTKRTLLDTISHITDIPDGVLSNRIQNAKISVAQRMSWASMRETTRIEDIAYCLMGIFNVNMPTLYGEGDKAFIRLQHEIMKSSDDHSLFAWSKIEDKSDTLSRNGSATDAEYIKKVMDRWFRPQTSESGLLSTSPRDFLYGRGIMETLSLDRGKHPFLMTNHGLQIWLPLVEAPDLGDGIYRAVLDCKVSDREGNLTIYLKEDESTGQYSRILSEIIHISDDWIFSAPRGIFVKDVYPADLVPVDRTPTSYFRLHLTKNTSETTGYRILTTSVDGFPEFIDVGHCLLHQQCAISSLQYFLISAKADASVQTLIAVNVSDPALWLGEGGQLLFLFNPRNTVDFSSTLNKEGLQEQIMNARFNTTLVDQSETLRVIDLTKGWKVSISFRKGPRTNSKVASHDTNMGIQHYRLLVKFIPPDLTNFFFEDRLPVPRFRPLEKCLPRFTVFIKPGYFTPQFWEALQKQRRDNLSQGLHDTDNSENIHHGVIFCLPRSSWAKTSMQEDGYSYLWTPTWRQRKAVVALGYQTHAISKLLELSLNEELKITFVLRDPVGNVDSQSLALEDLASSTSGPISYLKLEDLPDFAQYKIIPDVKPYSKSKPRDFVITMKERILVHEGGAMMYVEMPFLQYLD